ncbi:MAG: hypothetical protein HXY34_01220, partial [Candidatus Thorarchaeota archaeon]|nr:hypothetical protein [Candidatus Thorarchaeota archaeon]
YTDSWTSLTLGVWANLDTTASYYPRLVSKSPTTSSSGHIFASLINDTYGFLNRIRTDSTGGAYLTSCSVSTGTWYYLVWSWDGATDQLRAYANGVLVQAVTVAGTDLYNSVDVVVFANNNLNLGATRYLDGRLDEVRLTQSVLSADWILTEYRNQNSPSTFYSVGTESVNPSIWTSGDTIRVIYTTNSPTDVTLDVLMKTDISGNGQTLDENLANGTTYHVVNATNVAWTARVLVSPPQSTTSLQFSVEFPQEEWRPLTVTNPLGVTKTYGTQWWYEGSTLTVSAAAVDVFGVWALNFTGYNYVSNLLLGLNGGSMGQTANFTVGNTMEFRATVPWITNARQVLTLTSPTGTTWYTNTSTSTGTPSHEIPSFRYRKQITVAGSQVTGDQTNFPVLIDILDSDLHDSSKVQADGDDILFVQNGKIVPHDLEYFRQDYNPTQARLVAWVKVNLTDVADTVFYMYYGNTVVGAQEAPSKVWTNDYSAVWHLTEDVNDEQTTGTHYDSTGHGYDGNQNGTVEYLARVGYGQALDGNDWIRVTSTKSLDPSADVTISGWFYLNAAFSSSSATSYVVMEKYLSTSTNMHIALVGTDYGQGSVPRGTLVFKMENSDSARYKYTTRTLWTAGWYFFSVLLDSDTMSANKIYINGVDETSSGTVGTANTGSLSFSGDWGLGGGRADTADLASGYAYLPASSGIDELRVSTVQRGAGWIATEYANINNPGEFRTVGAEIERTSLTPTWVKVLDSTAPAGVWTVSVHYKDGATVDDGTGLYERRFIVKHATSLSLKSPGDAVGDGVSARLTGEVLYVEVELTDTVNSEKVSGATVKMNWTVSGSPQVKTLNDYGNGRYGLTLNTSDLVENRRWRIDIWSSHDYYIAASMYFSLDLSHTTELTYTDVTTTPVGQPFTVTLVYRDTFSSTPITGATIRFSNGTSITPVSEGDGRYNLSLYTGNLALGDHWFVFVVSKAGAYVADAEVNVTFTLRSHITTVSVQGDLVTPANMNTMLTVVLVDTDTGTSVPIGSVSSFSFTWSGGSQTVNSPSSYEVTLTTSTWPVGNRSVTIAVVMSGSTYQIPTNYVFSIEIRKHYTSVTVTGSLTAPYGNSTHLQVVITDLDTAGTLSHAYVSSLSFATAGYSDYNENSPSDLDVDLPTNSWTVGTHTVALTVTMTGIYNNPSTYNFDIDITALSTYLYHEPSDLVYPNGDDFYIVLRIEISQWGPYYGQLVKGETQSHFSAKNTSYTYPISLSEISAPSGRYGLTISYTFFPEGYYTITVTFTPTNATLQSSSLVITFRFRPANSEMSSPDRAVTTPFDTDFLVSISYIDTDRSLGITGATIWAAGISIYNPQDLGSGNYRVTVNVTGLGAGEHLYNLTIDKSGYQQQSLSFKVIIRIAYTYATPTVGALDIPVGNDPVFYVTYWDIDHAVPVTPEFPFVMTSNWVRAVTWVYLPGEQRYRLTFPTEVNDVLEQNRVVTFNFSKGSNYQFGIFNITVTIRTHNTDFRLVSAVEPTSVTGNFTIEVFYGDLDDNTGIRSFYVSHRLANLTNPSLISYLYNHTVLGDGYYYIHVPASQFGLGIQNFTLYFNWTGPVYTYQNKTILVTGNVIGQDSKYVLLLAAEPTPYLGNMTYSFLYAELYSGAGNTNETGNVHVYVVFQGYTVDLKKVTIWEVDRVGAPGRYSIRFNNTLLGTTGLVYMIVHVDWSKGAPPYYTNRTDTVSVRILARDTLVSLSPPIPTAYGENATLVFTFDDVTGESSQPIAYNPLNMSVTLSLADYSITYNDADKSFTVSFNTSQFGSLGTKVFTLSITWAGAPFYANQTMKQVEFTILIRRTQVDFQNPDRTPFGGQAVFNVSYLDIAGPSVVGISDATLTLLYGASTIPGSYYTATTDGYGTWTVSFNASYFSLPGTYLLTVNFTYTGTYYRADASATRSIEIRLRTTILSAEPIGSVPYGTNMVTVVTFQDALTLVNIGSSTTLTILNETGVAWAFNLTWRPASQDYLLSISMVGQPLALDVQYTLHLNMSYAYVSPYYRWDDAYVTFSIRARASALDVQQSAAPAPYNEYAVFVMYYWDTDSETGISGSVSFLLEEHGVIPTGSYQVTPGASGVYTIQLNSTALTTLGIHYIRVTAIWTGGVPYHNNAQRNTTIRVTERPANVDIISPPSRTQFLDNMTFTFAYTDVVTLGYIVVSPANIRLYSNGTLLLQTDFMLTSLGSIFEVSINSTVLGTTPVTNLNLTIVVDWNSLVVPYYTDDATFLRVSTTGRSMFVELRPIEVTPILDLMNISFFIEDTDTGRPVENAIILFSSITVPGSMVEGVTYWLWRGTGVDAGWYTIRVDTAVLVTTGDFLFSLTVQWDPNVSPYYANRSAITLTGSVDLIWAVLQTDLPQPSSVQVTDDVFVLVQYRDNDHGQIGVSGASIEVRYINNGQIPAGLTIIEVSPGVYNVSFSTIDITTTGTWTLNITATRSLYTSSSVQPTFTVRLIDTALEPLQTTIIANWSAPVTLTANYLDLLHGNYTSGGTVTYSVGTVNGTLFEQGTSGTYSGVLDTTQVGSGTRVVTMSATASGYVQAVAVITLVLQPLPSDVKAIDPTEQIIETSKGSPVNITVYLSNPLTGIPIPSIYVQEVKAYWEGNGVYYNFAWNGTEGYYVLYLPGSATGAAPTVGTYDLRVSARLINYNPGLSQYKIILTQTKTYVELDEESGTTEQMSAVYSQMVNVTVRLTEFFNRNQSISNATLTWTVTALDVTGPLYPTGTPGYFSALINTSILAYGDQAVTIRAVPGDSELANSFRVITISIARINTEVLRPLEFVVPWGWAGPLDFVYWDSSFGRPILNASAAYVWGPFTGNAIELGAGVYRVYINTSLLVPGTKYPISMNFVKANHIEGSGTVTMTLQLIATEVLIDVDEQNQIEGSSRRLRVPMGDTLNITLFYNDTEMFVGGIEGAYATSESSLRNPDAMEPLPVILTELGNGYYSFIFDTNDLRLYSLLNSTKTILRDPYRLTIQIALGNRSTVEFRIDIYIIEIPTSHSASVTGTTFTLTHLSPLEFTLYFNDTWHGMGVSGAEFVVESTNPSVALVAESRPVDGQPGLYYVRLETVGLGTTTVMISLGKQYYSDISYSIVIVVEPNETDILISRVTTIGLPISLVVILLLGTYVKVWSVPKRIRQINGQLKAIRKGRMPRPVPGVKSRQELLASLFNSMFAEMGITRTAAQMPEESVGVDIPEMGELLIQLSILTRLSPQELGDFKADISKMRLSEQATFVKEVITQEALRAARRDNKSVEQVLEEVASEAKRRLGEIEATRAVVAEEAEEEAVILRPEDERPSTGGPAVSDRDVRPRTTPSREFETTTAPSERLSQFELEELRKELEAKGVPLHEIDTIMEQAKTLPRDLVEELVRSLTGDK